MQLRVLHVIDDFSRLNTGVTSVVGQISAWQAKHCAWVGVYVSGFLDLPPPDGVEVFEVGSKPWTGSWRYPVGGMKKLVEVMRANKVNVLHIHGLWRASTLVAVSAGLRANVPMVLSAHGQTAEWALSGQGIFKSLKKKIYWAVAGRLKLMKVTNLHAITPLEQLDMHRFFGLSSTVIPNAVLVDAERIEPSVPRKYFVFLGRLHPVKGVENLIRAFIEAQFSDDWQLIIAGPEEDQEYVAQLKGLSEKFGDTIKFVGPVYGQDKQHLLVDAWALVAPSYTEVIGMVNLEAAALFTPSLTTSETGLFDWESGGGMLVSRDIASLRKSLKLCAAWPLNERISRGKQSRELVLKRYSLDVVGAQWVKFYSRIINKRLTYVEN